MPETFLAHFHWSLEPIHQASISVPEGMQPAMLDLQRVKQWVQLSDDISAVQRFTAFRGENQIQQVRPPRVQERPEVSRERSRDRKLPDRIRCLRSLNHVAPHCLPDADDPSLQVNVLDSQPKQ